MKSSTPRSNRLHIGIFGRRNAGKSSLINALTGQEAALVSDAPGTTTDPVFKSMELHPVGPVVFIDTAGLDDEGELGKLRVARTNDVISKTDLAILVMDASAADDTFERKLLQKLQEADVPVITVKNKCDQLRNSEIPASAEGCVFVSALTGEGIDRLRQSIVAAVSEENAPDHDASHSLLGSLVSTGDLVLLVMPQDIQAPKGRLILPQVQTIRELLDRNCSVMSTTSAGLKSALDSLNRAPDLIVTDSQCFGEVYKQKPEQSALTSFSILMAAAKGDINAFVDGVSVIDNARTSLAQGGMPSPLRVLIAEACTHVPLNEDIGSVKIPRILREAFGDQVTIDSVRGNDYPDADGLKEYDLIIHCGGCMFNRKAVLSRIAAAKAAGVPITNYGIFLAKMAGILDKVDLPE
ncbi:MAG: [FeFe] hydrogenase H-cluster maturation GTPase HydF [Bacillota bacterium]|nr:[FeFe] hydrogenase H-cluster maturation GTPase HydF [Bacillota bacterium]